MCLIACVYVHTFDVGAKVNIVCFKKKIVAKLLFCLNQKRELRLSINSADHSGSTIDDEHSMYSCAESLPHSPELGSQQVENCTPVNTFFFFSIFFSPTPMVVHVLVSCKRLFWWL